MLYKYLGIEGFKKTIDNSCLMFSNINSWRKGSVNDIQENYLASCIESEDGFEIMMRKFQQRDLPKEKVFQWMYYVCLYTYKTYASCFSGTINNQEYMWNEFTKNGGVCVCFRDDLYDELKARYSQGDSLSSIYSFVKSTINYVSNMPAIDSTLDHIDNRDNYLKLAYFTKRKDPYENEQEIRIAITEIQHLRDVLITELIRYTQDYDCSFQGLNNFINSKMGIDITENSPQYLQIEDLCKYINGIYISPNCGENDLNIIKGICNYKGITILEN